MSNCIITGGAGFIASHLAESLKNKYYTVYLIDNLLRTNGLRNIQHLLEDSKYQFVYGDINTFDFDSIPDVTAVYHLATTRINRCAKLNYEGHNIIANGGFRVVEFCSRKWAKMFFSSTASVYNNPKRFPIVETDPCVPHTIYGAAKYYTESLMRSFDKMYGFDYTINRFFCVYGDRMDSSGVYTEVIFNWLNGIRKGKKEITVYGDPDQKILDLIYVSDIVNAINISMEKSNNDVFNVSTETGVTLTELIQIIEKVTNQKLDKKTLQENRNDVELKRVGSVEKLRALGWEQKVSLEEGIRKTYEWITTLE